MARGRWAALISIFFTGATLSVPARSSAGLVDDLRAAPCPAAYDVYREERLGRETPWEPEQIDRARDDHEFLIHREYRLVEPPVNWHQDPYGSLRFTGLLHELTWLDVLFHGYQQGDLGALEQARDLVFDWIRRNPKGGRNTPWRAWVDRTSANRAPYLAYLARAGACEGILSRSQARELLDSLLVHAHFLENPKHHKPTNHGLSVDFALSTLGRQLRFTGEATDWRRLGRERFKRTLYNRIFTGEAFWLGHSTEYQLVVLDLLEHFLRGAGQGDGVLEALRDRMIDTGGWLIEPDGEVFQYGHTNLYPLDEQVLTAAADDTGMNVLWKTGLAVAKHPDAYLALTAGFHNTEHASADSLNFELFDHGQRIISDTGIYHADPDGNYSFGDSARAHSTLTVDRKGFPIDEPRWAYGSGITAAGQGDGWFAFRGKNPILNRKQGVMHHRLLLYMPGVALVVSDRVRSDRHHTYTRRVQLGPNIEASQSGDLVELSAPGLDGSLYCEDSGSGSTLSMFRGELDPMRGLTARRFREWTPRWAVKHTSAAEDVNYVCTLSLDETNVRAHLGRLGREVTELELGGDGSSAPDGVRVIRNGAELTITEL